MSDLLNEAIKDEAAEAAAAAVDPIEEEASEGIRLQMPDLSFLAAPTGAGSIDEYIEHPLNYDNSKSTARLLRGLTGIAGELDYALIDIGLGIIEKVQGRKAAPENGFNYVRE